MSNGRDPLLDLANSGEMSSTNNENGKLKEWAIWVIGFIFAVLPYIAVKVVWLNSQDGNGFYLFFGTPDLFLTYIGLLVSPWCFSMSNMKKYYNVFFILFIGLIIVNCLIYVALNVAGIMYSTFAVVFNIILFLASLAVPIIAFVIIHKQNKAQTQCK